MVASVAWCQEKGLKKKTWFASVILAFLFRIVEFFSQLIFWLMYKMKAKITLPPINNALLLDSASNLAKKIRTRQVTSEEVVMVFIERIKAVNPIINCVVDDRFALALEEARNIDQLIQSGDKDETTLELETPFLGVPFTIKDCFSVKGLRYTAGLFKRKNIIGQFDSDVVVLMKKAGAIMLAITNVPELCMWWETHNIIFGRSRNPYDTNRTVGGSSGGEAGLLAACGSPFGIGADIGGSIRIPSSFNGIFGHKPTTGIVSNHGQQPPSEGELDKFNVTGPMSRFSSDLLPMYRILAASNIKKLKLDTKEFMSMLRKITRTVSLSKLRYFYIDSFGNHPLVNKVHPDIQKAQLAVVNHIGKMYNIPVKKVNISKLLHATEMWFVKICSAGKIPFTAELAMRQGEISILKEFVKYWIGKSENTLFALEMASLFKCCPTSSHPLSVKLTALYEELRQELKNLLGDDGVLLAPTHPTPAFYHNESLIKPFNPGYTAIFSVLGLPVTQVPLGLGSWGVPLGLQVVGNFYNDHLTLAVAAELERAFGGWVPPSAVAC